MEGLPMLPGNSFVDPTKTRFHRSQSLGYKNGYAQQKRPEVGIGGVPIPYNQLSEQELDELANYKPTLTYGQAKQAPPEDFVPAHVAWDKKVLKFLAWYKQTVHESPDEHYRIRHVNVFLYLEDDSVAVVEPHVENSGLPQGKQAATFTRSARRSFSCCLLFKAYYKQTVHESPNEHFRIRLVSVYYYPEDDSISVIEPHVENSGMPQGKLIKRQRLPKNDVGDHWTWKDLNIGMNVTFYGKVFHIYDCDGWTRDFLESEGLEVNPPEDFPVDPYNEKRTEASALRTFKTKSDFDKLRQFLEMDRKVLRFFCVWDDRDQMFGEMRKFIIHYYLVDDTLEVREVHSANDGRDPFPILICRQKVPKDRYNVESTFPGVVMELTDNEIKEYFTPKDFALGKTVQIFNRRFLIYDVDNFTKAFYWKNFNITDFNAVDVDSVKTEKPKMEIPPYNGFGSLEDSMQSCLSLIPQPPKKDFIKMLENDGRVLRFEAVLDSTKPEDRKRRFIISYRLSDEMITIYEPPSRNSGIVSGKFLERTRVAKPGSTPDMPVFYGPHDFFIGAVIEVFSHRFVITNADEYVLKYMEEHSNQFPESTVQSLRAKLCPTKARTSSARSFKPGELDALVQEVKGQLKKVAITANNRKDRVFLGVDVDRQGYISRENLKEMCQKQHLPADDDIILRLAQEIGREPDHISLAEFRQFFESA